MHGLNALDPGRSIDWGKTSADYAAHRPGPPEGFYARLAALGVGLPGQRILDLGTGTGLLARRFAQAGCTVAASDISAGQIEAARALAAEQGLDIDFRVAAAEAPVFDAASFDAITANQCWLYFDVERMLPEVKRLLAPGGVLVTSHFSWLPRCDPIAAASEALVLRFNPAWGGVDWAGEIPPLPAWAENRAAGRMRLRAMFWYDEPIAFTRTAWCGRIRACRGIGATLSEAEVAAFDQAHEELLARIVGENFAVLHRIDAHILEPL
jgi:SAM-dependent methyltransferase